MKVVKTIKTIRQCPKCGRSEALRLYDTVDVETNKPIKTALYVYDWTFDDLTAFPPYGPAVYETDTGRFRHSPPIANVSFSEQPSEARMAGVKKTLLGAMKEAQCLHGSEHVWRQLYNTNVGPFVQCRKCGRCQDKDGLLIVPDRPWLGLLEILDAVDDLKQMSDE